MVLFFEVLEVVAMVAIIVRSDPWFWFTRCYKGVVLVVAAMLEVADSKANKAFKSDSQRLAFFIPSLSSVFTVVWLG